MIFGWSPSFLSLLLSGKRGASEVDIAAFLGVCRVKGAGAAAGAVPRAGHPRLVPGLFSRDRPARFTFYLHESVLRLPVGGPAVMAEQLRHLQRMSERSYLTLWVVPVAFGAHAATAGAFRLMEFAEFKPVAYLESETSSVSLEKPEEVAAYRRILGALTDTALGEGQSRELIAALATELYADGEDHDDRA
jgi:Domain of unknown function (DUF5753)